MVPLNPSSSAGQLLLVDARARLDRELEAGPPGDVATMFSYWLTGQLVSGSATKSLVGQLVERSGAQQDFQTVAALGFALDAGLLDSVGAEAFRRGLSRLAGRSAFVDGMPMPFCSDAVGVLGIAVGTRALADATISRNIVAWLGTFLGVIERMSGIEDWQRCLFHAADAVLGRSIGISPVISEASSDVRAALASKGILAPLDGAEEKATLLFIARSTTEPLSYERAVLRSVALNWVVRAAPVLTPEHVTVEALVRVLKRVPAGLRKWTWELDPRIPSTPARRWDIDHEYHVQNLLWAILSPIFPDLDDEQYLAKIGQKNPRADFIIPSLKVVVEAKYWRAHERPQKIVDEIAADLTLYRALGNACDGVIAFVWDVGARIHEHDYLRQGLKKLEGLIDAVIVSRPQDWLESSAKSRRGTRARFGSRTSSPGSQRRPPVK